MEHAPLRKDKALTPTEAPQESRLNIHSRARARTACSASWRREDARDVSRWQLGEPGAAEAGICCNRTWRCKNSILLAVQLMADTAEKH